MDLNLRCYWRSVYTLLDFMRLVAFVCPVRYDALRLGSSLFVHLFNTLYEMSDFRAGSFEFSSRTGKKIGRHEQNKKKKSCSLLRESTFLRVDEIPAQNICSFDEKLMVEGRKNSHAHT